MERQIDDEVKQKLLDSLAEEPTMVLSTAYAYAKNYVKYGEDITKEWTTVVQQSAVIEKVSLNAWAQAHETFRREYETRFKADLAAMLEDIQLEIEEIVKEEELIDKKWANGLHYSEKIIQQRINELKENKDGKTNRC